MAVSYVLTTLFIALALEALVVTAAYFFITQSPALGYFTLQRAGHAAQILSLQAAIQTNEAGLNPDITFETGRPDSLNLRGENDPPELSYMNLDVPFIEPGSPAPATPTFALLVDTDETVLTSSYPERYPAGLNAAQALPDEDMILIRNALSGDPGGRVKETLPNRYAAVAHTVWSRDRQPLGAVYIQAPSGLPAQGDLFSNIAGVLIPSALGGLCLMLPIGLLFGFLTTRSVIPRIERLAHATSRFTRGDFSQRVPVSRSDEIGQLEQQFNGMAEQLVDSFAQRQALAEQSARREERARIEQEMSSAHYIQKALLPRDAPSIQGWQIETYYRPAREVGGDLYDFLTLPDGRLGIVIGDVTGKGMPAALIMATTCAMIRVATQNATSPGEVLSLVNNMLQVYIPPTMFATCFYAILDPATGCLKFANAGHDIPYLRRDGKIIELRATGMPLGLMPDQSYPELEQTIDPNDSILFSTDGLVEAHDAEREMFGSPRLKNLLQNHSHEDGLINFLLNELQGFTGEGWEQEDDVTLIVLKKTT